MSIVLFALGAPAWYKFVANPDEYVPGSLEHASEVFGRIALYVIVPGAFAIGYLHSRTRRRRAAAKQKDA